MATDKLIRGYAEALFAIAEAEGELDRVEGELYAFAKALEGSEELRAALTDAGLPADRKQALISDLIGGRAHAHTVNVISFLVEQGRARDLDKIIAELAEVAAEHRNAAMAEVRTAVELSDAQTKKIADALSKTTGRKIEVRVVIDPTVIGGLVARIGDEIIDGSVRTRLDEATLRLKGA